MNISYIAGIVTAAAFDPFQYASCVFAPSTVVSTASTASAAPTTLWADMDARDDPICIGNGIYVTSSASNATATVITSTAGSTVTLYGVPTVYPPDEWLRAKESQNVQRITTTQTNGASDTRVSISQIVLATLITSSALLF
ncbi:hypothetical protein CJU90_1388 [Yarrowia sp. C11]|nr:hypothetical protein CKK34_0114 [Yarrowia sp. E02]KAG5371370.1 hypothetical protein CJU90_1388 [Yarrowia sp. C11]